MWSKVWVKQIRYYERIMKRTPPIVKIIVWFFMVAWFIPFLLAHGAAWLLGWYECNSCKKTMHMFKHPKGNEDLEVDVCEACYPSWKQSNPAGRD